MDWLKEFASYKDVFIKDVRGLIGINSIRDEDSVKSDAPFGAGCRKALDYMLELGRKDGFQVLDYNGYAGVIVYGEGNESVGVLAHLDIVPIGEGWNKDAFKGVIEDGYLFGRGALDDKGPAMGAYYALKMLKDKKIKLNKKVLLILGCDEESGMECMDYYCKHGEIPSVGFTPDADFPVIYGEKGGIHVHLCGHAKTVITKMHAGERPNIVIGKAQATLQYWNKDFDSLFSFYLQSHNLTGDLHYENDEPILSIEGIFAHGAMPYKGINAATHLLNFIGSAFHDSFAKQTADLLMNWTGQGLGIDFEGAYMGFLTMNTGIVTIENNTIDIILDIRYPNDDKADTIKAQIEKRIKEVSYPLDVEVIVKAEPLFIAPDSKLVTTLTDVYRHYSHDETSANVTIGGGTYAKKFKNFVAYGPEFPKHQAPENLFVGGPHQRDEGILLEDLYMAVAIYTQAIEELAK